MPILERALQRIPRKVGQGVPSPLPEAQKQGGAVAARVRGANQAPVRGGEEVLDRNRDDSSGLLTEPPPVQGQEDPGTLQKLPGDGGQSEAVVAGGRPATVGPGFGAGQAVEGDLAALSRAQLPPDKEQVLQIPRTCCQKRSEFNLLS